MAKRRNFEIITYQLDKDSTLKLLKSIAYVQKYAFIVHDKDTFTDEDEQKNPEHKSGTLKEPHMHIMISCNNSYTPQRIATDFGVELNRIEFIKSSYAHAVRYLTHEIAPDKFLYSAEELIANFDYAKLKKADTHKDSLKQRKDDLIRDIIEGTIKKYELADKFDAYDIDPLYLVKWNKEIERAFTVRYDKLSRQTNRNLDVIYIQGKSGTGKTTLGKILAQKKGLDICITSGNNKDMLSSYQGQPCLLIDDPGQETFSSWNESLKLLDNHTSSNYKSRYNDKSLAEVELLIITSTLGIDSLFNYWGFEKKQIHRRIQTLIKIDQENAQVFEYNDSKDIYLPVYSFKNPLQEYIEEQNKEKEEVKNHAIAWIKEQF